MSADPKLVTAIIVGAGNRGSIYQTYAQAHKNRLKIVGVAEPRKFYREQIQSQHQIKEENCFEGWEEAIAREKMADSALIAIPDRLHKVAAVEFAKKGYHILLEKPMAVTEADCREIVKTCKENSVIISVCHVLRYSPWANRLKEIIDSGVIGEVVNIQHLEPVGYWYFAHSFVRGNWHKEDNSSFSLLAKCCHDINLINFWMSGKRCLSLSSFGHLSHFNRENKPPGAASRCFECLTTVESTCPYSAIKIYLNQIEKGYKGFPVSIIAEEPSIESVTDALKTGRYGVCVYDNDNDVMSNQVVNMQFEGGATATLTMMGFTQGISTREIKIHGTRGELSCVANSRPVIKHFDFLTNCLHEYVIEPVKGSSIMPGHCGADYHVMHSFVTDVANGGCEKSIVTGPDDCLASHVLVFAAEKARRERRVVCLQPDGTYN